jgi:hypothetical protein
MNIRKWLHSPHTVKNCEKEERIGAWVYKRINEK